LTLSASDDRFNAKLTGPRFDVRVVLFTVHNDALWIGLSKGPHELRLPAGSAFPGESLDTVAARILAEELNAAESYLEQLYSLAHQDESGWSVAISYLAVTSPEWSDMATRIAWHDASRLPPLHRLDQRFVEYAITRLRAKLGYTTIAFHLLPPEFTMSELQNVYEVILGQKLDKRNFRRRVQGAGLLEPTGSQRREGSHRPAQLFRFRAVHDPDTYLVPGWSVNWGEEAVKT
jgi:8-oxo-dGTP diphosphatase